MHREISGAVPLASGEFAPEVINLTGDNGATGFGSTKVINEVSVLVDTIVSDAVVVVEVLAPDTKDYITARELTSAGLAELIQFAGVMGVRIRVRSGGTAGTQRVVAAWR